MTAMYGILSGTIISEVKCGRVPEGPEVVVLPDSWPGVVGSDIRWFTPDLCRYRPVEELIAAGVRTLSPEEKIEEGVIVAKNAFERIRDGIDPPPKGRKLVISPEGDMDLAAMTYDEQIAARQLTPEVAFSLKLRDCEISRKAAYIDESDPIRFLVDEGQINPATGVPYTMADWLAKKAEIRARYPKPV